MTFNLSNCVPSLIYGDLVKRQIAIVCTFLLWYCHKEEKVTSITREENLKVWLARSYLRLSVASSSMSFPIIVNRFTGWGFWEVLHYLQFMHHKLLRRLHLSHHSFENVCKWWNQNIRTLHRIIAWLYLPRFSSSIFGRLFLCCITWIL